MLANESLSRGNALPVRALVKTGWFISAGAVVPMEAPPCSALCPGGTRVWAGELMLSEHCALGAEVVAEQLGCGPRAQPPCAMVQSGSAPAWINLGAALSCSPWPAVGTVVKDLRVDPQPCPLGTRRGRQGTAHQHSWEQGPAPRRLLSGGRH